MADDKILNNDNVIVKGNFEATGDITATGGINGLTLSNGISGTNFNITGINQLEINDPGEGIVFKSGSSGDITLAIVDDSSDNILRLSGTGATLQVGTNAVWHAGDFTSTNVSNWNTAYGWGDHASAGYLTAHPSITQASNVDNSGGTVIQDLTFDSNGHVTATNSVNLDNIYTSTDGTENDFRFSLNLGNFSGTRWYKVATVNTGSGGLRIRGLLTNHVESFGSSMVDLGIQGRENNENGNIEITGHVNVLYQNAGIAVISGSQPSHYLNWEVYVVATKYTQCELDLTIVGGSFDTSGSSVTTQPSGTVELDTSSLSEGNYVVRDSSVRRIFDDGITLSGGLSYNSSTNTLSQTDNNTTYSNATTSAAGLMSSTDKTKIDGIASGAEVNVQSDWNATSGDAYIQNKPTLGTAASSAATDFLAASGDTLTGKLKVTGSIVHEYSSAGGYIPFPKGAMYTTTTNAHTGAIRIKIPVRSTYDMVKFVVEIFDYTSNESVTINIGGYINGGDNQWVNQTVVTLADSTSKDYKVRFGVSDEKSSIIFNTQSFLCSF